MVCYTKCSKASLPKIGMPLVKFFNLMLEKGQFPEKWTKGMRCTMHKKSSVTDPENYRGIWLLPTLCKMLTKTLNERLGIYPDKTGLRCKEQAAYHKNYSTIDQIFVLQSVVQKHLLKKKGRFYIMLADFAKAFSNHLGSIPCLFPLFLGQSQR